MKIWACLLEGIQMPLSGEEGGDGVVVEEEAAESSGMFDMIVVL
jgi:hypothetical protein